MLSQTKTRKKYVFRADSLKRVEEELRFRVSADLWRPGVMLPSRRRLATEFGVDLHTVQRAIAPLLEDGTLNAVAGRGTFVSKQRDGEAESSGSRTSLDFAASGASQRSDANRIVRFSPPVSIGTLGIIAAYDATRGTQDDIAGLGTQFVDAGGKTVVYNVLRPDGTRESIPKAAETLIKRGIDLLAVVGIDYSPVFRDIRVPLSNGKSVPVVYVSGRGEYQSAISVYYDYKQAGLQAANHLLSIGCSNLVFVVPFTTPWLEERVEGAYLALKHAGLDSSHLYVHPASHPLEPWSIDAPVECDVAIEEAFEKNLFNDGVIAPNDGVAHHIIHHAGLRGKKVGRDFGLIGFDDIPSSTFAGLTSLRPPFEQMGKEACSLLIRLLGGESVNMQLCLPSDLIIRHSTADYAGVASR
jgi:DNA-binding LacI/PurR family transcriptional regulator